MYSLCWEHCNTDSIRNYVAASKIAF